MRVPVDAPVSRRDGGDFVAARDRWLALLPDPDALQARAQAPAQTNGPRSPGSAPSGSAGATSHAR